MGRGGEDEGVGGVGVERWFCWGFGALGGKAGILMVGNGAWEHGLTCCV